MRAQAVRGMADSARLQARLLEDALLRGTADARFLAQLEDLGNLAASPAHSGAGFAELQQHVLGEFTALGRSTGLYSTIRYADASGKERARVDFGPEGVTIVPERELQDLTNQGYFGPSLQFPPGAVFVSPLGLNRENGRIEEPHRPVIRFASPVSRGGKTLGLVVLSAEADPLLPRATYAGGQTFLADPEGYYLSHTDPARAWSGARNLSTGHNVQRDYGPNALAALGPSESVLPHSGGLLATYPLLFGPPQAGNFMVLGVEAREELIFSGLEDYRRFFWGVFAISFVAPVLAGLALATFFLRPMRQLRRAVHAVAEGDLDTTLDVRSGDEFQMLAQDFNTMAARLREYQQQERLALVGRMAASIIHDVRNPLAALTVSTRLLTEKELPEAQRREVGERAMAQADRILAMLQEILEFTRTGKTDIEKRPEDLRAILAEMEYGLTTQCAARGIALSLGNVPDCVVEVDRGKLQRALTNIALNGCEVSSPGDALTVSAQLDGEGVSIEIADGGPGLPPEIEDRLFEPFATYGKAHGTGLGLAITRAIVEAHGGRVSARNGDTGGAVFTLWLPRAPE
jgi:signal transduction histidine kinase